MARRMINQRSYKGQDVAVKEISANLVIQDYKIERIGKLVVGSVKLEILDTNDTPEKLFEIQGIPEAYGAFVGRATTVDLETMTAGSMLLYGSNYHDEIMISGKFMNKGEVVFNFEYMVGGNR